ncbi:MAG TPA: glycosyltransferase [Pyrinomonadaceae bacterium]|nr:glycosyltransferase [Pyrinomonadaceae bacterium]
MNQASLVSVIIPCYGQAHFLDDAIRSVHAQSYRQFEIIVVDDGSPDNTAEVAARYDDGLVRLIRQRNLGLATARNNGLRASAGDFIVFLDADDRLLPRALETGVNSLYAAPECAFVYGLCEFIDQEGSPIPTPPHVAVKENYHRAFLRDNPILSPGAAMFRRSIFSRVAGFDPSLSRGCEDLDLYLRIAKEWPVHCHGKTTLQYRKHRGSMSANRFRMLRASNKLFRKHLREVAGERELEELCRLKIIPRRQLILQQPTLNRIIATVRLRTRLRAVGSYVRQNLPEWTRVRRASR